MLAQPTDLRASPAAVAPKLFPTHGFWCAPVVVEVVSATVVALVANCFAGVALVRLTRIVRDRRRPGDAASAHEIRQTDTADKQQSAAWRYM